MVSLLFALTTLLSLASAISLPPNLHSRQATSLKPGAWIITYTPNAANSPTYRGPLRITSTSDATFISGDLYNGTVQPNPADGSPILPRNNYWGFVRATKLTAGSNRGFSLNLEFWTFGGFRQTVRYWDTIWAGQPVDGGYIVELSPASAPSGYPDTQNYFEGNVKIASSGAVVGKFTMGWVSTYLRRIKLEIGTVSGAKVPQADTSGTRTWKSVFAEAGYDISVTVGKTDIPEPSNTVGAGWFNEEQEHDAVLTYRGPTDYDKEWKYYLLIVRHMVESSRGAMIDPTRKYNGIPREGTAIASEWRVGTNPDGTPDTIDNVPWPASVVGKKFEDLQDPWFRTAVHEGEVP
ncbi:uncharacterized protein EI97DRAFT_221361 [Westerdykella ornata]|uniref:Concanavalin A-like lectin/glucanase n=1 Tax=Westerdykella ornata TaxID=318751 RepID=A0A6A6JR35_WESOR|nr:uncharacterized protein EI97DRAFT_221361 [Westerdykella ornata]KAF2278847.1 hypothetical protein EI97DRAFT_221361 [Westerdykella ornata]